MGLGETLWDDGSLIWDQEVDSSNLSTPTSVGRQQLHGSSPIGADEAPR
jgi:hypothetical protein